MSTPLYSTVIGCTHQRIVPFVTPMTFHENGNDVSLLMGSVRLHYIYDGSKHTFARITTIFHLYIQVRVFFYVEDRGFVDVPSGHVRATWEAPFWCSVKVSNAMHHLEKLDEVTYQHVVEMCAGR